MSPAPAAAGAAVPTHAVTEAPPRRPPDTVTTIDPGWHAAMIAWLHRNKVYPPEARERGEEGTGQVRFTVARDGVVRAVTILEGTGSPALDAALRRLLTEARLPVFPPAMTQDQVSVRMRISYGLDP
jgi:protein TonB